MIYFILALFAGFSFAFYIIVSNVKKTNDIGDSKASFHHFSEKPLRMIYSKDRV